MLQGVREHTALDKIPPTRKLDPGLDMIFLSTGLMIAHHGLLQGLPITTTHYNQSPRMPNDAATRDLAASSSF